MHTIDFDAFFEILNIFKTFFHVYYLNLKFKFKIFWIFLIFNYFFKRIIRLLLFLVLLIHSCYLSLLTLLTCLTNSNLSIYSPKMVTKLDYFEQKF